MEEIEVKNILIDPTTIRASAEARLGEELPLQFLETTDENGNLLDSYNEGNPVAIFHDGSVSSVFRIEAPDTYYLSPEKMEELLNGLDSVLTTQSRAHNLHFFWTTSDLDNETLNEFLAQNDIRGQHPAQKFLRTAQTLREKERLLKGELKSYKAYVLLSTPYPKKSGKNHSKKGGINSMPQMILSSMETMFSELLNLGALLNRPGEFKTEEKILKEQIKKNVERTKLLKESFQQLSGINTFEVKTGEFLALYKRSWSPNAWSFTKKMNGDLQETPKRPLRSGLANHYATDQIQDNGTNWESEGFHHSILTLRQTPSYSDVGVMLSSIVLGRGKEIHQLEYSLILKPTDGRQELNLLSRNLRIFTKQYETDPSRYAGHPLQIRALQTQIEKLHQSEGTPGYYATLVIHIWNKNKQELESWKNTIFQNYARPPVSARFGEEQYHALPFFTNKCQPGYTTDGDNSRDHALLSREAATFVPLLSGASSFLQESPVDRRIIALLETELGTLQPLDWFARGRVSNYGGVGVGTSGSGKSYFYNRIIAGTVSDKDSVIVIDGAVANGSYRNNAMVLAGEASYIQTTREDSQETHCINILETEEIGGYMRTATDEEIQRMTSNIEPMLRENTETPLNSPDRLLLSSAIRMAFESPRQEKGFVFLRDVAHSLKNNFKGRNDSQRQRAVLLGQSLEDGFCHPHGTYRQFFDGPSTPIPEGLVIFDNQGIKDDPLLRGVLVAAQFAHIDRVVNKNMNRASDERKRIHVYIDEAWKALKDPVTSEFISGMYRAGRARNISPHLITQKMADLRELLMITDRSAGDSQMNMESNEILGNCSWFNLFKHDPADALVTQEVLRLSDRQTEALQGLGGTSEYKEMIQYAIMNNGRFFSKLRYRPTELEFPLFTSDSHELGVMKTIVQEMYIKLGWDQPQSLAKARNETIARLADAGFLNMNAYSNNQIMALLASWEFVLRRRKNLNKGNPVQH